MSSRRAAAARLEDRLDGRENNFDVLRLLAAGLVLFSHCYPLTGSAEPFAELTGWTLGEVGVVMFFAMSGFLIAKSWSDQPYVRAFSVKRALRLLPALVVAVTVTTFVLGPLFTQVPLSTYFTDPGTWTYWLRSSLLVTFDGHLPGVFADNVYPGAVNGSLWTLPVETCCYVMAAALGVLGLLRRRSLLAAAAAVLLLCTTPLSPLSAAPGVTAGGGNVGIVIQLGATFVLGSLLYSLRGRLRLSWLLLGALAVVFVLTWKTRWVTATGVLFLTFGVLVTGFRTPAWLRRLTAPGDVSYGVYVYAFPVQQSVSALWGPRLDPLVMLVIAFPATYALALASWRIVERPALALKRRFAPAAARASAGRDVAVDPVPAGLAQGHVVAAAHLGGGQRGDDGELRLGEQR